MSVSKTVTTSGTAQTVTLDTATIQNITIVNLSATAAEYVSCTVASRQAPETAVVDANDTIPVQAGESVTFNVGPTADARASIIAASGTPKVAVIGT